MLGSPAEWRALYGCIVMLFVLTCIIGCAIGHFLLR